MSRTYEGTTRRERLLIGAIPVRNRCDFHDTTAHFKAKKNRHILGSPECGGVLYGGAGGN